YDARGGWVPGGGEGTMPTTGRWMLGVVVGGTWLLLTACGGTAATVASPRSASAGAAATVPAQPTVAPRPSVATQPTAVAQPTAAQRPTVARPTIAPTAARTVAPSTAVPTPYIDKVFYDRAREKLLVELDQVIQFVQDNRDPQSRDGVVKNFTDDIQATAKQWDDQGDHATAKSLDAQTTARTVTDAA